MINKNDNEETSKSIDYREMIDAISQDTPVHLLPEKLEDVLRNLANESPAKANAVLTGPIKTRFDLTLNQISSYEKTVREYRKQAISQSLAKQDEKEVEEFSNEEKTAALQILQSPKLLHDVLQIVGQLGVVGEEKNTLIHYLAITSRLLKHPISVTVKGDSSAGKSYLVSKVLELFPKSEYIDLTDATPQSFYYVPDDRYKHKMIIIFEKHGSEKADYAIRSLQSEGKLKIYVVEKNPITGQLVTNEYEKEGPVGFITTTTQSMIHAENETRNISVFPDQSASQTARIYEANDAQYLGNELPSDETLRLWRCAQLLLKSFPVLIPFAPALRKYFPKNILRTRRDHSHLLALIEVSTVLHQEQRKKIEKNNKEYLLATLADYEIALIAAEESLSKSIHELSPQTEKAIKCATELFTGIEDTFTNSMLGRHLGWDSETVAKWMKPAIAKGYVSIVEESKGSRPAKFHVEEKDLPGGRFLPSAPEIIGETPKESLEGAYDPITGDDIVENTPIESPDAPPVTEDIAEQKNFFGDTTPALNPYQEP